MQKTILLINLLICQFISGFGQCNLSSLLPFESGSTRYTVNLKLLEMKNITKEYVPSLSDFFYWDKPDYLNGDSVYKSWIFSYYNNNDCIVGHKNKLRFDFVDDRLYKKSLKISFNKDEFVECMKIFNSLVNHYKPKYVPGNKIIQRHSTNEKFGEGVNFIFKENNKYLEELNIDYWIIYKEEFSQITHMPILTDEIEGFYLEIEYVNLFGTKLNKSSY